jgi:hypothetical protein
MVLVERSHPFNFPTSFFNEPLQTQRTQRKSDTFGQLRYRIPSTPQKRLFIFIKLVRLTPPAVKCP